MKQISSATSGLTASESSKSVGSSIAASSKGACNNLGQNAQVKSQVKSTSKDSNDQYRNGDCLFNEPQLGAVRKKAQEVEKCRSDVLESSRASNSTRPQVRQHASNEWAEQGGVKQAQKSKVGKSLTI